MNKKDIIYQTYNLVNAIESLGVQLRDLKGDNPETLKMVQDWIRHPATQKRFGPYFEILLKKDNLFLYYLPNRIKDPVDYLIKPLENFVNWIFNSKEVTNYTYDLTDLNKDQLAWFVSNISSESVQSVKKYMDEIENDHLLKDHIFNLNKKDPLLGFFCDDEIKYSRRIGWYAFIRILKPEIVVETGVDKGLGSCVIANALMKNSEEGKSGYLYGVDIIKNAGYLFQEPYNRFGEIIYSDAIDALKKFDKKVDIFIHDSMHEDNYEYNEYKAIEHCLNDDTLILSDDSTFSMALSKFAIETGRKFHFFKEEPQDHFYSGEGIGIAYK